MQIKEFSELSSIPITTLRYYDEIGLIKPNSVDPITNYRHYSEEQLNDIKIISFLKACGFELKEIINYNLLNLSKCEDKSQLRMHLSRKRLSIIEQMKMQMEQLRNLDVLEKSSGSKVKIMLPYVPNKK